MAKVTKGYNSPTGFISGETVTPEKIHQLVDNATVTNIVNADIAATAAIDHTKLANITSARVLMGNASNIPTATAISGDIGISNTGVATIGAGAVTAAKFRDSVALSVVGRSDNSAGDVVDITAGTDGHVLRQSGSVLDFGTIGLTSLALPSDFPIQVVQAVKSDVQVIDTDTTSWVDVTGLGYTLTRRIASSAGAVRIQASIACSSNLSDTAPAFRIVRGSTVIGVGNNATSSRLEATMTGAFNYDHNVASYSLDFIDNSPGNTPTVAYKIQARMYSGGQGYINRSKDDRDNGDYSYRTISTMTLTELTP